jgi:hypothetical protein
MLANTACACANAADSVSDIDPHAHHLIEGDAADTGNSLCPHQACEGCEVLEYAATPERDVNLISFANLGFADDIVWVDVTDFDIAPRLPFVTKTTLTFQNPLRRAETPVRRADYLLE